MSFYLQRDFTYSEISYMKNAVHSTSCFLGFYKRCQEIIAIYIVFIPYTCWYGMLEAKYIAKFRNYLRLLKHIFIDVKSSSKRVLLLLCFDAKFCFYIYLNFGFLRFTYTSILTFNTKVFLFFIYALWSNIVTKSILSKSI